MTGARRGAGAGRPARPSRPALSRAYIVSTALALIDRDGIAGLSMRRLGAELGVDPMAVYHHLPSKAALFDGVVEAVWAEIGLDSLDATGTWRQQTERFLRRMRAVLRSHPNALPILSTRPATAPSTLPILDRALGLLVAAGLRVGDALDMTNCLGTFTIGFTIAEVGEPVGGGETLDPEQALAGLDPQAAPHIAKALADGYTFRPDEQYELGLAAMLDGFERRYGS